MPSSRPTVDPWDALSLFVGGWVVAAHVAWIAVDQRVPRDLGNFYESMPRLAVTPFLRHGQWAALLREISKKGGWINMLHAKLQATWGPSDDLFASVDVAWMLLLLVSTWAVGRRLAGPRAGTAALALITTSPMVIWLGRQAWIHLPEAALVMGAVALLTIDPKLRRRLTVAGLVLSGGLALLLRESAVVWVGLLVPVAVVLTWKAPWPRKVALAAGWALAAVPAVTGLSRYIAPKLASHDRYASTSGTLWTQLTAIPGEQTMALVALGLALGALALLRGRGARMDRSRVAILAWLLAVPFTVVVILKVFASGIADHVLFMPAVALLAAVGFARGPRWTVALPLAASALVTVTPWLPEPTAEAIARYAPGLPMPASRTDINNAARPYTLFGEPHVRALLGASCPERGNCAIGTFGGLYGPSTEDGGRLSLFLSGETRAHIHPLDRGRLPRIPMNAVAVYACAHEDPLAMPHLAGWVDQQGLEPSWTRRLDDRCTLTWLTQGGELNGTVP